MREKEPVSAQRVWAEYEKGVAFKTQINLYDTVTVNEDFFIGKQWEGVNANGLPTPVFNIIKRIVLYLVATTATDNVAISVTPLCNSHPLSDGLIWGPRQSPKGFVGERQKGPADMEFSAAPQAGNGMEQVISAEFDAIMEHNKLPALIRGFMRDAAVRGDGCVYSWFDLDAETGQEARGAIRTELLENTRVIFGNPNSRDVQSQPYIIISRRERLEDVRREAKEQGDGEDAVRPEGDETGDRVDAMTDDKVTTLTRFEKRSGHVWCVKTVKDGIVRREWNTGMKLYPLVWMCWDHVTNCCHGQAAVTGLIPNQTFVNKVFAMTMISLMTTAFPKIVYDKTRVAKWDSGVGKAIGVNGGDVNSVARALDPATVSPQIGQFIELAVSMTKELMGATDAALGNVRPDNTSAILALQKSSSVPMELVKQDLYQAVEDLGRIWLDQMRGYYGARLVTRDSAVSLFDFAALENVPMSLKLDVGGSAYWSEIAQLQTLDNLLASGQITIIDYLERLPNGYISNQQELIETLKQRQQAAEQAAMTQMQSADQPMAI